ncbi:MAG: Flagellin N-methylase [Methanomassiliicoccales archaeon PtaU1.Bin124]|nr:MAG: Flagellin N-methylase [Methanomassiliicoccales archaeon PtaU1.Bin124]
MSINNSYQVDLSELEGRKLTCIEGCGLCCLCQPELLEQEVPYFRKNYPNRIVAKRQPHKHFALSMKKKVGSCSFLNDRRCDVYSVRPHFCRQFPFHIHVGTRVQVELDLSCRGVWLDKGEDCVTLGTQLVAENDRAIKQVFAQSGDVYRQYYRNCMDMECDCRPQELRDEMAPRLGMFNDLNFIAALLEASAEEEELDLQTLKVPEMDARKLKELEDAAIEAARDSLGTADPFDAPIYCAEDNAWNIFRFEDESIERYVLTDEGDLDHISSIEPEAIKLQAPVDSGKNIMESYMALLNRRDSLLGNAFHLMDEYAYEDYMSNIYYGVMATSALDVLWRASLLSNVYGNRLDGKGIREGIIYYDMDRLDAPTIGSFI